MPIKVLLAGSVHGKFEAFVKRCQSVNTKAGPFVAVLCCGQFFGTGDAGSKCPEWVTSILDGTIQLPVPVYITSSHGEGSEAALLSIAEAPGSAIQLLDEGVRSVVGLRIATFDDRQAENHSAFTAKLMSNEGDVDLLLTTSWPEGVTAGAQGHVEECAPSAAVARVVEACRPRYHFASSSETFYQREPYTNKDLGAGESITRFISLAAVGNATKGKWLHALALEPAFKMSPAELTAKPDGCTHSPFTLAPRGKRRATQQPWRWGEEAGKRANKNRPAVPVDTSKSVFVRNLPFGATDEDVKAFFSKAAAVVDVRWKEGHDGKKQSWAHVQFETEEGMKAACELSGQALLGRELGVHVAEEGGSSRLNLGNPVADCWFCLSNSNADAHLVVDVLEHSYLAIDKGPITDSHALVVAVEHYPCTVMLKEQAVLEVDKVIQSLRSAYGSRGLDLLGFERYLAFHSRGGNHCHLNFIGISRHAAASAKSSIDAAAAKHGFSFTHLPGPISGVKGQQAVKDAVGTGQYFQAFLPDGSRLVHPITRNERHPMLFGRQVLSTLAGVPERADWKQCKAADAAEEEEKAVAFQQFYMPFQSPTEPNAPAGT